MFEVRAGNEGAIEAVLVVFWWKWNFQKTPTADEDLLPFFFSNATMNFCLWVQK